MRLLCQDHALLPSQRPYADGRGASLYVGDGAPGDNPREDVILYRRNYIFDGAEQLVALGETVDLGGASFVKTPAVDQVDSPADELSYAIPAALHGRVVWAQVRTFEDDVENETIYRPRRLVLDGDGELDAQILGTARITELVKRDAGGLLVRFVYESSRDGVQPAQFVLARTAGPTTPNPVVLIASGSRRNYEIEVAGLTNAGAYTFKLSAENSPASVDLVTGIAFTADGAGPSGASGLVAAEY